MSWRLIALTAEVDSYVDPSFSAPESDACCGA